MWQTRVALMSALVALGSAVFTLYKSVVYDRQIAAMEVAQKDLDLTVARDAILAYGFGEPVVTPMKAASTGSLDSGKERTVPLQKMVMVTVPVTIKNISKLPIAVDFNEQWAFLGRLLGPAHGSHAEALNASNDSYPIAWRRSQCIIGVASDAWENLGLHSVVVSQAKARRLRELGPAFWKTSDLLTGSVEELRKNAVNLSSAEATAQFDHLRAIVGKPPYYATSEVGAACTLLNGGVFVATLRAGEEKALKATYIVRGEEQWFSHILRLHYRQTRPAAEDKPWACRPRAWNPLPTVAARLGLDWCTGPQPAKAVVYRFQDLRQTVFLQPGHAAAR